MRSVFADTAYWIALANPFDRHHSAALAASTALGKTRLLTTDAVLVEFLNAMADKGPHLRAAVLQTVENILRDPAVHVLPQTRRMFLRSMAFYKARPDKGYSFTDCWSMLVMRDRRLSDVLTTDRHFEQEGFVALLRASSKH